MKNSDSQREVKFFNNKVDSSNLFGLSNELIIIHNGEEYKLRLTSNGKLILTK